MWIVQCEGTINFVLFLALVLLGGLFVLKFIFFIKLRLSAVKLRELALKLLNLHAM